jgi:hypothetical protein
MRSIVGLASVGRSRCRCQFAHFSADRFEWAVSMLLPAETIDVGAVRSIDRLLEADRKIAFEVCHFWPILVDDVGRYIIGLFIREHRSVCRGTWARYPYQGQCGIFAGNAVQVARERNRIQQSAIRSNDEEERGKGKSR